MYSEYKLYLIGEGESKEKIIDKVRNENLEDKVRFLGSVPNVNEYMIISNLFLFPSLHEGLPVVVVEAQAAGLRCVLSEEVSKEVKITDLVEFISLNDSAKIWCDKIISSSNYVKSSQTEAIKKNKYDIESISNFFLDLYLK